MSLLNNIFRRGLQHETRLRGLMILATVVIALLLLSPASYSSDNAGSIQDTTNEPSRPLGMLPDACTTQTSWLFNDASSLSGWTLNNMEAVYLDASAGVLVLNPGNDPHMITPCLIRPASSINYVKTSMKNKGTDTNGELFYMSPQYPAFSGSRRAAFQNPNNGDYNAVIVRLDNIPGWSGSTNIDFIRFDPVGNGNGGSDDVLIDYFFLRKDLYAPNQPTIKSVTPSSWTNGSISVWFTSNDPPDVAPVGPDSYGSGVDFFLYRIGSTSYLTKYPDYFNRIFGDADATVSYSAGSLPNGITTFQVYCKDHTGKTSTVRSTSLYYDGLNPSQPGAITITPTLNKSNSFAVSWGAASDSHSGIAGYYYKVNSGSETWTTSRSLPAAARATVQGTNTFYVRAKDVAGNIGAYRTATFVYDPQAPTTPPSATVNPSLNKANSFAFSWTASSDAISGVKGYYWKVNSGSETYTTSLSVSAGAYATVSGTNTFYVRAIDNAGNYSSQRIKTFVYDPQAPTAPPTVTATPGSNNTNAFAFSWSAGSDAISGVAGYNWKVNSGSETFTSTTSVPSAAHATIQGTNIVSVRTKDVAGNYSGYTTAEFFFDDQPPTDPSNVVASPVFSNVNSFGFDWSASTDATSGLAGYQWKINGGPENPVGSSPLAPFICATFEGTNLFAVRAIDNLDNPSAWIPTEFVYDTTGPTTPSNGQASPGASNANNFAFTWDASIDLLMDVLGYYWSVNGGGETFTPDPIMTAGPYADVQGTNTVQVRAVDEAGNSSDSLAIEFVYDTEPPTVPPGLHVEPVYSSVNSFSFFWLPSSDAVSGVQGYYWHVNDDPETFATETYVLPGAHEVNPGYNWFYLRASDEAGNLSALDSVTFYLGCCIYKTGNVDCDPDDIVDIGDLTVLIAYMFIPPFDPLCCVEEANINGEGIVDIGDITALIGYLFIPPFTPPASCP